MSPALHPTEPSRIVLVGMMGSGKTTVGRLLGKRIGWRYVDNDELLAAVADGRTAREVAADLGEGGLRRAESAALYAGLTTPEPCIVSAAAGIILDPANRAAIAEAGMVVWLRARPETLARRATGVTHRPWLDGDAHKWFRMEVREREPLFASIADLIVHVDDLTPAAAADSLIARLRLAAFLPATRGA